MFCHAVQDILGLKSGKTWDDVRRELSDEQVKRIHEAFGSLWPGDTDLSELLPRPRKDTFRAVYLGVSDPRIVEAMVLGWLPYFDQVVLTHPFINPLHIKPEFSPTKSPSQHKAQTLKNVLLLLLLEPYIQAGYLHLIPDPGDFNPQFGMSVLQMAEQRTAGWKPARNSMGRLEALAEDDHRRLMRQLPESSLKRSMRQHMSEASDAEIEAAIMHIKSELAADPYALLQPIAPGEAGAQSLYFKGYSLESAMYLASLTGSAIYTDVEAHWQQLHIHARQADRASNTVWAPVVDSLRAVDFPIDINPQTIYEALQAGRFGSMKAVLRQFVDVAQLQSGAPRADQIALQLTKAAQAMEGEWADLPGTLRLVGHIELSVPVGGFELNDVRRLLLTFGRAKSVRPISFAMLVKFEAATAADG